MPMPFMQQVVNRMNGELFRLQHPNYLLPQYLEPTNICNLRCPDCPIGELKMERGFMSMDTVDKVMEVMRPGKPLHLYLMGEPLLHEKIAEIVYKTSMHPKRIYTLLSTNGMLLSERMTRTLTTNGLKALVVSLHKKESVEAFLTAAQYLEDKEYPTLEGRHILTNPLVPQWLDEVGVDAKYRSLITKCNPHGFAGNVTSKRRVLSEYQMDNRIQSCKLLNWKVCAVRWNGVINACPYDDRNQCSLGHIDNFQDLKHNIPYKICQCCDDTAYTVQE
jgi:hypothetical protein